MKLVLTAYWILCFFLTHLPPSQVPALAHGLDKVIHFAGYGLLGLLLCLNTKSRLRAILILVIYSLFDETTQPLVGRAFEWFDLSADLVGGCLGISLAAWALSQKKIFPAE